MKQKHSEKKGELEKYHSVKGLAHQVKEISQGLAQKESGGQ